MRQKASEDNQQRYFENLASHDTMMKMLGTLFKYMSGPGEISQRKVKTTSVGQRRFLDVDVQGLDGAWERRRFYVRAQPSREIFRCDLPFGRDRIISELDRRRPSQPLTQHTFNESVKDELAGSRVNLTKRVIRGRPRRPVLIAPMLSSSVRPIVIEQHVAWWRNFVIWKPRLRTQENKTGCAISLDWLAAFGDLAKLVRWFFKRIATRIMRARWGSPKDEKEKEVSEKAISLVEFMRPDPWPPPSRQFSLK